MKDMESLFMVHLLFKLNHLKWPYCNPLLPFSLRNERECLLALGIKLDKKEEGNDVVVVVEIKSSVFWSKD